eukprot:gnl/MRDRNA2_/MRDRNA2_144290_c0_seq1.p1 gnl/MRDRNA2_/MRDRNA2_144290_c0~~gnl/MRDRNA2_/MRDRNA2_144290_c0_seq1.p1  ORF type:complete len:237 (-),score=58.16 gnl/MRDRNA2_/MRDRNA2_144290_c0_seq1:41-751(-)
MVTRGLLNGTAFIVDSLFKCLLPKLQSPEHFKNVDCKWASSIIPIMDAAELHCFRTSEWDMLLHLAYEDTSEVFDELMRTMGPGALLCGDGEARTLFHTAAALGNDHNATQRLAVLAKHVHQLSMLSGQDTVQKALAARDTTGRTALYEVGDPETLGVLLSMGYWDINAVDFMGSSVLDIAQAHGRFLKSNATVEALVQHGAKPADLLTTKEGRKARKETLSLDRDQDNRPKPQEL